MVPALEPAPNIWTKFEKINLNETTIIKYMIDLENYQSACQFPQVTYKWDFFQNFKIYFNLIIFK